MIFIDFEICENNPPKKDFLVGVYEARSVPHFYTLQVFNITSLLYKGNNKEGVQY